jgi:hypothetical protein
MHHIGDELHCYILHQIHGLLQADSITGTAGPLPVKEDPLPVWRPPCLLTGTSSLVPDTAAGSHAHARTREAGHIPMSPHWPLLRDQSAERPVLGMRVRGQDAG